MLLKRQCKSLLIPSFLDNPIHICRIMYATHIHNVLSNNICGGSSSTKSSKIYGDLLVLVFTLTYPFIRSFIRLFFRASKSVDSSNHCQQQLAAYFPLNFIRVLLHKYHLWISCVVTTVVYTWWYTFCLFCKILKNIFVCFLMWRLFSFLRNISFMTI